MEQLKHAPWPGPNEIWEDWEIDSWSFLENGAFCTELTGITSRLIYSEQPVINRVTAYIAEIISKAKAGELSHEAAVNLVKWDVVFSQKELEVIKANVQKYGEMLGKFYSEKSTPD